MPLTYLPPLDRDDADDDGDDERPPLYPESEAMFARAAAERERLTRDGIEMGDPNYTAPGEWIAQGNALVRELNASL